MKTIGIMLLSVLALADPGFLSEIETAFVHFDANGDGIVTKQ